jgi:hypothetical protein
VTERIADAIGADRTSVRLSPNGNTQGCEDSDPPALFVPAARELDRIGIAFLELREVGPEGTFGTTDQPKVSPVLRPVFKRPLVLNQDYRLDNAQADLASGRADAISFGRPFIGNPDLVERLQTGAPLATDDMATWYSQVRKAMSITRCSRRSPPRRSDSENGLSHKCSLCPAHADESRTEVRQTILWLGSDAGRARVPDITGDAACKDRRGAQAHAKVSPPP